MSQRAGRSPGWGQIDFRRPELHLSAGHCQAWHLHVLVTEGTGFPFFFPGKGVWTLQGGKGSWEGCKTEAEGGREHGADAQWTEGGECQAWFELDSAQLCSFLPTQGMPVDVNSAAFRLWQILNGTSFHGCIRNLYINNELQDFTKTRMKPGVVPGCEPCRKLYCLHGICQPNATPGPVCHCEAGWGGLHCDQPADGPCHGHK